MNPSRAGRSPWCSLLGSCTRRRRRGVQGAAAGARRRSAAGAQHASSAPTSATPAARRADGIEVALKEAQFELDAAGASVALERSAVADAQAARDAGGARAEGRRRRDRVRPAGRLAARRCRRHAAAGAQRRRRRRSAARARLPRAPVAPAAERAHARRCAGADAGGAPLEQVLLLTGPSALDAERARGGAGRDQALRRSSSCRAKPFKLSADPRERDLANPRC